MPLGEGDRMAAARDLCGGRESDDAGADDEGVE
jgi:hypothetical protein